MSPKIITDDRAVNKYILCYGQLLSQKEMFAKLEELSGEKIESQYVRRLPVFTLDPLLGG